jgi:GNAT superfamily N-acetyltransferase
MPTDSLVVRRTVEGDWAEVRALRLEMLLDTPEAFAETHAAALTRPEAEWRMRAARGSSEGSVNLAAIAEGRWVGTMGAYLPDAVTGPMLVGVYVTPSFRGRDAGVADALLAGVERWAAERGSTLTLHVHERNERAIAFYLARGFAATGRQFAYVLDEAELEFEMRKAVRQAP